MRPDLGPIHFYVWLYPQLKVILDLERKAIFDLERKVILDLASAHHYFFQTLTRSACVILSLVAFPLTAHIIDRYFSIHERNQVRLELGFGLGFILESDVGLRQGFGIRASWGSQTSVSEVSQEVPLHPGQYTNKSTGSPIRSSPSTADNVYPLECVSFFSV